MTSTQVTAPLELLASVQQYERPAATSDEHGERAWSPEYFGPADRPTEA